MLNTEEVGIILVALGIPIMMTVIVIVIGAFGGRPRSEQFHEFLAESEEERKR